MMLTAGVFFINDQHPLLMLLLQHRYRRIYIYPILVVGFREKASKM